METIFNYCERTDIGLLAEPLNLFSNLAFLLAAWLAWRLYRKGPADPAIAKVIALVALVGIGSALFHSFANSLTMFADVLPIAVFVYYYLWLALPRLLGLSRKSTLYALSAFTITAIWCAATPKAYQLNGSLLYVPCLLALVVIAIALYHRRHAAARLLILGATCFAVSLTMRTIDFAVCNSFPIGTHFFWHMLNGVLLYLLLKALIIICTHSKRV